MSCVQNIEQAQIDAAATVLVVEVTAIENERDKKENFCLSFVLPYIHCDRERKKRKE